MDLECRVHIVTILTGVSHSNKSLILSGFFLDLICENPEVVPKYYAPRPAWPVHRLRRCPAFSRAGCLITKVIEWTQHFLQGLWFHLWKMKFSFENFQKQYYRSYLIFNSSQLSFYLNDNWPMMHEVFLSYWFEPLTSKHIK